MTEKKSEHLYSETNDEEKRYVLAIDQGTTSSRAIVFAPDLTVTAVAQREFAQRTIDLATEWGDNAYLMPVRTSPAEYLQGLRVPEPARA